MSLPHWFKKLCLCLPIALACCQHSEKKEEAQTDPTALVILGENRDPVFNATGTKILFVSSRRPGHAHAQIYEKDLQTGVEQRITFQNGNAASPHYVPGIDAIIYSSSTDELKENPPFLNTNKNPSQLPAVYQQPFEIYLHKLRGLEITRLTNGAGFDGEAHFNAKNLVFTRVRKNRAHIFARSFNPRSLALGSEVEWKGLGYNPTQLTDSHSGQIRAWVDWDESFGVAKLYWQKRLNNSYEPAEEIASEFIVPKTDLLFTGDDRFLIFTMISHGKNDLWSFEFARKCLRRLFPTRSSLDRQGAAFSPDQKWMVFSEGSRIYRVPFQPPSGPCPEKP